MDWSESSILIGQLAIKYATNFMGHLLSATDRKNPVLISVLNVSWYPHPMPSVPLAQTPQVFPV